MTGSTGDIIAIVIVAILVLGFWLGAVYYANSHPRWANQPREEPFAQHPLEGTVPAQRLSSPGPVIPGQREGTAADEFTPEQAQAGEIRKE